MKRSAWVFCSTTYRGHWKDGENGFEWKHRYLSEQRSRAMDFLFDVSKRKPIHDSIRDYHKIMWNESAPVDGLRDAVHEYDEDLREKKLRAGVMGDFYNASARTEKGADTKLPENETEDIFGKIAYAQTVQAQSAIDENKSTGGLPSEPCSMEDFHDTLDFLSADDLELLADEFRPKTTHTRINEQQLMNNVMRCRKTMSPKHSYAKIPQQERTTWSPWYLRHLTQRDGEK